MEYDESQLQAGTWRAPLPSMKVQNEYIKGDFEGAESVVSSERTEELCSMKPRRPSLQSTSDLPVCYRRTGTRRWSAALMAGQLQVQGLQDRVLILVGSGALLETMAKKRLAHGGRLCVVETGESTVVQMVEVPFGCPLTVWDPPPAAKVGKRSALAVQLKAEPKVHGIKCGPDVTQVPEGARLEVLVCQEEKVGVRVVEVEEGKTLWQLNGMVIVDPSEYEAQLMDLSVWDHECQPMIMISIRNTVIATLSWLALMVPGIIFSVFMEARSSPGSIPWWRALIWSANGFYYVWTSCVYVCVLAVAGDRMGPTDTLVCSLIGSAIAGGICLAGGGAYIAATSACSVAIPFSLRHYYRTMTTYPERSFIRHALLGTAFVTLTLGLVYIFGAITMMYVFLLGNGLGGIAAIFLTISVSAIEQGTVILATLSYRKLISDARAQALGGVAGDQRVFMTTVVMLAHGWAESTRLASVCAGTIRTPESWDWLASMVFSVCMNAMSRTGWSQWLKSYVLGSLGKKTTSLGTAMGRLHAHTRRSCGYPRFASVILLVLTRLSYTGDLDPGSPRFFFFNRMFLTSFFMFVFTEILEDVVVHYTAAPPFMQKHIQHYMAFGTYDVRQLLVLQKGTQGIKKTLFAMDSAHGNTPHSPLLLHGARIMPLFDMLGLIGILANVTTFSFELMLGPGYVRGLCDYPLESMGTSIMQWIYVEVPYPCN